MDKEELSFILLLFASLLLFIVFLTVTDLLSNIIAMKLPKFLTNLFSRNKDKVFIIDEFKPKIEQNLNHFKQYGATTAKEVEEYENPYREFNLPANKTGIIVNREDVLNIGGELPKHKIVNILEGIKKANSNELISYSEQLKFANAHPGELIKFLISDYGMSDSTREMAKDIDISYEFLRRIINGTRNISNDTAKKLDTYFKQPNGTFGIMMVNYYNSKTNDKTTNTE